MIQALTAAIQTQTAKTQVQITVAQAQTATQILTARPLPRTTQEAQTLTQAIM